MTLDTEHRLADAAFRLIAGAGATREAPTRRTVRKIAVILPVPYRGGSFRGFKSIAKMLSHGSQLAGDPVEVVAAVPAGQYDFRTDFRDLRELGITVRPYDWQTLDRATLSRALAFVSDAALPLEAYVESIVPDDGINHLLDCDFWLVVSDRVSRPIAPLRPVGHVIYDYIQQIRPDIFARDFDDRSYLTSAQRARFVLCTTPFTAAAAVNYAGVAAERVHVADMEIEVDLENMALGGQPFRMSRPTIVWPSNTSPHKNQLGALDALELYFGRYGGTFDVVCTGVNTHWFDPEAPTLPQHADPWIKSVRDRIQRSRSLLTRLKFTGELSEADYFATVGGSEFLFHPALVDNGTYAVTEAAWFAVPSLCHDYPAIRWMDERFALGLSYCDARDADDTARALVAMEKDLEGRRALLPPREQLRRHGWRSHARTFWSLAGGLMESAS